MAIKAILKKKDDRKARGLLKFLTELDNQYAQAGYFDSQGVHSGERNTQGLSYAELMKIHEDGVSSMKIPPRPIFSMTFTGSEKEIVRESLQIFKRDLDGVARTRYRSPKGTLNAVGMVIKEHLHRMFGSAQLEENLYWWRTSKSLKGSSTRPMIETGELRDKLAFANTIDNKVKES